MQSEHGGCSWLRMQYPEQIWDSKIEPPLTSDQDAVEALAFLDKMKVKHGDKSVIYVR